MDPKLTSKELCCAVIDVLTLGLTHERVEDAEAVLAALRCLRPRVAEFDTFEAWILMKRGLFSDAIRLLRNTANSSHGGVQARALLTYCQYAAGDAGWMDSATQVIDAGADEEASQLMRLLLDPEAAVRQKEEQAEAAEGVHSLASAVPTSFSGAYLRA